MSNQGKQPCLSIGLPIYNGEQFLPETLDSILAQTFTDFELIICDNGSTDNTPKICQEYAERDRRIRYYWNEKNIGAAPNYNRVFELSKGKYFKWSAHDDLIAPEFLEKCISLLEEKPEIVLCFPKTNIIDENGQIIGKHSNNLDLVSRLANERFEQFHRRLSKFTLCDPVFGVIRRDQLSKTPLIGHYIASDTTLLGELALLGKFQEVPEYLFSRRHHPQMSTVANHDWDKRIRWFDPDKEGKLIFPHWSLYFGYIGAINRAVSNWDEKLKCYGIVSDYLLFKREDLFRVN